MSFWTDEEEKILREQYPTIKRTKDMLFLLPNKTYPAIICRAFVKGIKRPEKYSKNENFFEIPNLLNSYWVGFLNGDAHLMEDRFGKISKIEIGLKIETKYHLERFRSDTSSNFLVTTRSTISVINTVRNKNKEKREYFKAEIICYKTQKWGEDLGRNWSVVGGKKTFRIAYPPKELTIENMLAFLKGEIDSDGTIYFNITKFKLKNGQTAEQKNMFIVFLGTKSLLDGIKLFVEKVLKRKVRGKVNLERPDSKIYRFGVASSNALQLFNILKSIETPEIKAKWENPKILGYIEEQKIKNPHLFDYKLTEEELKEPNNIVVNIKDEIIDLNVERPESPAAFEQISQIPEKTVINIAA